MSLYNLVNKANLVHNFSLYVCFSWWWAHSRPKHVQKRNKHTKKIFSEYNQQDAPFLKFIYFCKMLYMLQTGFPSIIRSTKLHIQWKDRLKHVGRLTETNKFEKHCILLVVLWEYISDARTYECYILKKIVHQVGFIYKMQNFVGWKMKGIKVLMWIFAHQCSVVGCWFISVCVMTKLTYLLTYLLHGAESFFCS